MKFGNDLGQGVRAREDRKTANSPMHLCSFTALHACHLLPARVRYRSESTSLQHLFCHSNDYYSSSPYHHLWLLQGHWYHFPFSCSQICCMVLTTNRNTFILGCLKFLAVRSVYFCSGIYLTVPSGEKLPSFGAGGRRFFFYYCTISAWSWQKIQII